MKILFVIPSYKPAYIYGGPAVSVSELAESLVATGHSVTVYTTTANGKAELDVKPGVPIDVQGVTVYYLSRQTGDHTHVSIGLWRKLWTTASRYDIIHLQSWWSLLIFGAAAICRLKGCSYIISPRGMLSSYSFERQHSLAKKVLHLTLGQSLLKRSILHATTALEWKDCLKVNPSWKGFVLPNIIRFPRNTFKEKKSAISSPLVLGFLSRIDPKKGLELLFEALAKSDCNYVLKIAGKGDDDYISSLKTLAQNFQIADKIDWCGWKAGEEKYQFLQSIDVFVLTSYNENFANAVIEALAVGTPVFLSQEVGLADYVIKNDLGWVCDTTIDSISDGLQRIFAEQKKISRINSRSPSLVHEDFDKMVLARQYSAVYKKLFSPATQTAS